MATASHTPHQEESPQFAYEDRLLREIATQGKRRHVLWEIAARGGPAMHSFDDVVKDESLEGLPFKEQVSKYIESLKIYDNETQDVTNSTYRDARWGDLVDQVEASLDGHRSHAASLMDWYRSSEVYSADKVPSVPDSAHFHEARRMDPKPVGVTIYNDDLYYVVTHRSGHHRLAFTTDERTDAYDRAALERAVLTSEFRVMEQRNSLIRRGWDLRHALLGAIDDTADDLSIEFRVQRSALYNRLRATFDTLPVDGSRTSKGITPNP